MTAVRDIRLLIADVDGTLVTNDKRLTPAACAAARDLRAAGIGLALTSARPPFGMRMLVGPLGLDLPLAGFNGGLIVDDDLHELESHPIAPGVAKAATRFLAEAGLDVWTYTDAAWFVSRAEGPYVDRERFILQVDPRIAGESRLPARVFKIVGVSDDEAKMAAAEAAAKTHFEGEASVSRSAHHYLDFTDVKATKGLVVRSLAQRLDLSTSQIATIGDMPNDVLMFRESGLSIAMGNAAEDVKAEADAATASNEDDGFAKAVRDFVLTPETTGARP